MSLLDRVRSFTSKCLSPLAARAARAYVAGEHLDDALRAADRLSRKGLAATIGYWDSLDDSPRLVADAYLAGVRAIAGREHSYLSIKVPALDYSSELMSELTAQAANYQVRLHFDALSPDTAERSRVLCDEFLDRGADLSYTLPGRWVRSLADARWAIERKLVVRVVKGQWADLDQPDRDPRRGFLDVIDVLAGRARHVAVATHDAALVTEAVRRLRAAGTSCELELLHGLPMRTSLERAHWLALGVRVYVPYGKAYLPYALARLRQNPRMAMWLARDLVIGCCQWGNLIGPKARELATAESG